MKANEKKALSGFTPGPWVVDNNEGYQCTIGNEYAFSSVYPADCEHRYICDVRGPDRKWKSPSDETKANAALIAVAPELLRSCKDMIEFLKTGIDERSTEDLARLILNINNAIASATRTV